MRKEVAMELADRLESGKYKQIKGVLERGMDGDCCALGVLCNMAVEKGIVERIPHSLGNKFGCENYSSQTLPVKKICDWAGVNHAKFLVKYADDKPAESIMVLNDNGYSFKTLARLIREQYKDI